MRGTDKSNMVIALMLGALVGTIFIGTCCPEPLPGMVRETGPRAAFCLALISSIILGLPFGEVFAKLRYAQLAEIGKEFFSLALGVIIGAASTLVAEAVFFSTVSRWADFVFGLTFLGIMILLFYLLGQGEENRRKRIEAGGITWDRLVH